MNNLGQLLQDQGQLEEATLLLRDALERYRRVLGDDHPDTIGSINSYGMVLGTAGDVQASEPFHREALERSRQVLGENHPDTLFYMNNFARVLQAQHNLETAEPLLKELYLRASKAQISPQNAALIMARYGLCLTQLGKYREANEPLIDVYKRLRSAGLEKHVRMHDVVAALAEVCAQTNRPDEASKWRSELARLDAATRPTLAPTTAPTSRSVVSPG
jgi:tetratricopeptide (TPR) repeat protein